MEWLRKQAQEQPNKRYINDLTFAGVYERVRHLMAQLHLVLGDRTRVGVYATNSVEAALLLLALMGLGIEIVCLNARLTEAEMRAQAAQLDVHVVLTNRRSSYCYDAKLCCFHLADIQKVCTTPSGWERADACLTRPLDPERIAMIMNTSATTGTFKSVPMRWKQWMAHVKASAAVLGVKASDTWLVVLPIFHVSGLSILLRSLYNGTGVWIEEHFDPAVCAKRIQEGQISLVSLVPTMWGQLLPLLEAETGYGCLRCVLLGGESIPEGLVQASLAKQLPIYKTYGMTETVSQCATVNLLAHPDKKDSVGYPLSGMQVRIDNPDADGIGEVVLRGPMLMDGYLGKEPVTGDFHTGDIGYVDADGYLYLLNRRQDLIISGGENIYPKEIEDVVSQFPGVRECAVLGRADERWGQVPVLYVSGDGLDTENLQLYMQERLAKYKVPKEIVVMTALPRNATGKILRRALAAEEL